MSANSLSQLLLYVQGGVLKSPRIALPHCGH